MPRLLCLPLLFLWAACATPARLVVTESDTTTTVADAAVAMAGADVVVLGEVHHHPEVHALHLALLERLYERRRDVVVAMEMFERDVQTVVLQYLAGLVDEDTFRAEARTWPRYESDYRPIVEFCRANGVPLLAANLPQELATRVARQGIGSVAGERHAARETTAPQDEYWDAFVDSVGKDEAHSAHGKLENLYAAQCLRDDTMAETVTDHMRNRYAAGERPLCVLICGRGHSDYGRGVVARIESRMPELDVRVVSTEIVRDLADREYSVPRTIADYVVVAEGTPDVATARRPARTEAPPAMRRPEPATPAEPPAAGRRPEPSGEQNPEGLRPALGFMPDYADAGGSGVLVGAVTAGGPAERAGIEEGDYITVLGGIEITDVQSYAEALDEQIIGKTITVRVRRGEAEVDLQVQVGSRPAR